LTESFIDVYEHVEKSVALPTYSRCTNTVTETFDLLYQQWQGTYGCLHS